MNRARRWVGRRFAGVAVAAAVYVVAFPFYGVDREFLGDEPSYLLYATSLARGWGVDLRRAYEPETRTWISTVPSSPMPRSGVPMAHMRAGTVSACRSCSRPLAGRVPRSVIRAFMILFASALTYHLFALVRTTTGASAAAAGIAVFAVMASPPIIFHASLVYARSPGRLAGRRRAAVSRKRAPRAGTTDGCRCRGGASAMAQHALRHAHRRARRGCRWACVQLESGCVCNASHRR